MLVPTNLGIVLIHGLHAIDPELALPTYSLSGRYISRQQSQIGNGKANIPHRDWKSAFRRCIEQ